jgi:hypothetical protein
VWFCPVCAQRLIQVRGDDYEKLKAENGELKEEVERLDSALDGYIVEVTATRSKNEELKKCFESLLGYYCEAIPYLPKELRDELKRNCEAIKKEQGV